MIKFENKLSTMDLVSIACMVVVFIKVFVAQGAEIDRLHGVTKDLKDDLVKVEKTTHAVKQDIMNQLALYRTEQKEDLDRLERKLDKLIDRELRTAL